MSDEYSDEEWIVIADIDEALRPALDMRVGLDDEAVMAYAEAVGTLPPVLLIHDAASATHWVVDGRHRISGAIQAGKRKVKARIKEGNYEDAWREASRANEINGVRVTNADKRNRVERALLNGAWQKWSTRKIADLCGVSAPFVASLRDDPGVNDLHQEAEDPVPTRTDARGREQPAKKPKLKRPYKNDETPLLDDRVRDPGPDPGPDMSDRPYEPPPPFVPPVLDMDEVDWLACWADVEAGVMQHYNAWPAVQRGLFVECLMAFAERLHSIERERGEGSDAEQTIPADA